MTISLFVFTPDYQNLTLKYVNFKPFPLNNHELLTNCPSAKFVLLLTKRIVAQRVAYF